MYLIVSKRVCVYIYIYIIYTCTCAQRHCACEPVSFFETKPAAYWHRLNRRTSPIPNGPQLTLLPRALYHHASCIRFVFPLPIYIYIYIPDTLNCPQLSLLHSPRTMVMLPSDFLSSRTLLSIFSLRPALSLMASLRLALRLVTIVQSNNSSLETTNNFPTLESTSLRSLPLFIPLLFLFLFLTLLLLHIAFCFLLLLLLPFSSSFLPSFPLFFFQLRRGQPFVTTCSRHYETEMLFI